jgi:hypothetical protein
MSYGYEIDTIYSMYISEEKNYHWILIHLKMNRQNDKTADIDIMEPKNIRSHQTPICSNGEGASSHSP